ncbi:MAG: hypothetical protein AAF822_11490 [Pseudomonadota bacterium]
MLDFTNTPERRKKARQARTRKTMIYLGLAVLVPATAMALDLQGLAAAVAG